jgi:hypothetical protein
MLLPKAQAQPRRVSLAQRVEPTSTIALLRRAKMAAYVRTPSMATHAHAQTETQETNVKHHLYPAAPQIALAASALASLAAIATASVAAGAAALIMSLLALLLAAVIALAIVHAESSFFVARMRLLPTRTRGVGR